MNPLERLLELQAHDTRISQLEHRHAQLPERAELLALESQSQDLAERIEAARQQHAELERHHRRYDDDLAMVLEKRERERNLLYSGEVTAIRELQGLEEEVAALGRRQRVVEDKLLEVMEELEVAGTDLAALSRSHRELGSRMDSVNVRLGAAATEIDAELEQVRLARADVGKEVDSGLLERYERLRSQIDGVAVARLEGTICMGCYLTLPLMEVDRLRRLPEVGEAPPGEDDKGTATCPSCGRILVI